MSGSTSGNGRVPDLGILVTLVWQPCIFFWREYLPDLYNEIMEPGDCCLWPVRAQCALEMLFDISQNETQARGEDAVSDN